MTALKPLLGLPIYSALAATICALLLVGCSFCRQNASGLPVEAQSIVLECAEPYGDLCRALRRKLWYYGFKVVEQGQEATLRLNILKSAPQRSTLSLFPDGKSSQYQLTMRVSAEFHSAGRAPCRIKVALGQSVVDNPHSPLAKSSEVEMNYRLLYDQAAERIVLRLLTILSTQATKSGSGTQQATDNIDAIPEP